MVEMILAKSTALGVLFGKVCVPPLAATWALAEGMINEQTGVPLTIVAAVGGACWYLNGRFTKLEDGQESLQREIGQIKEKVLQA